MLKQLLASVGIGNTKVDTKLNQRSVAPGQSLSGVIEVRGGDVVQQIDGFDLALMTRMKVSTDDGEYMQNHCLQRFRLMDKFTIGPGEQRDVSFNLTIGYETPITQIPMSHRCKVWLSTAADIQMAIDPTDEDLLQITSPDVVSQSLQAMQHLGFKLVKADIEKGYLNLGSARSQSGCYQEFEFRPTHFSSVKEVELSFLLGAQESKIVIEIDRAFRGDSYRVVNVANHASVEHIMNALRSQIGL